MNPVRDCLVRFGVFEVDLSLAELRKRGRTVRLQSQPYQVLALLLSRPGELISRDELRQKLWPDGTFVEFDQAINTAIRKLRYVLGDSAENPRFIETVPKEGYRFIAPVDRPAEPATVANVSIVTSPRLRSPRYVWFALAAVALLSWAAYGLRTAVPSEEPYIVLPLTSLVGNERDPSFSPDGRQIVFAWDRGEGPNSNLYIMTVGQENVDRLTSGVGDDRSPSWSPDGRYIAFVRRTPTRMLVMLIPGSGAVHRAEKVLMDSPAWSDMTFAPSLSYVAWTPDGAWLIAAENDFTGERIGLTAVSIRTGEKRILTRPPPEWMADVNPSISPDSQMLSFTRLASIGSGDLYVLRLAADLQPSAPPNRIDLEGSLTGSTAWINDSHLIFPMRSRTNLWQLHQIAPSRPDNVKVLASFGDNVRYLAISRAGRRLAVARENRDENVWRVGPLNCGGRVPGQVRAGCSPQPFLTSTRGDGHARFSPDGRRIAFHSARSGAFEIWLCDADGSNAVQLTHLRARTAGLPSWSHDGRRIAFHARTYAQGEIFVMDSDGSNLKQLTTEGQENIGPSWSRNGEWVYFASHRTGHYEIWKVRADGTHASQVTRNGGVSAIESPDGRYLYYARYGGTALFRVDLATGGEQPLDQVVLANDSSWTISSSGIWFAGRTPVTSGQHLSIMRFANQQVEQIAVLPGNLGFGLSVSPDERFILYSRLNQMGSDLVLVEGFRSLGTRAEPLVPRLWESHSRVARGEYHVR